MPVPIPFGTRHTAVVEGSIDRLVVCEQCGIEYVFMVEGTAEAASTALLFSDESTARAVACQNAEQALVVQLRNAVEPVPCPSCGHYQAAMVTRMKSNHLNWMYQLGIFVWILVPVLLLVALFGTMVANT